MMLSDKLVSEAYFANFGNAPTCYEITYFSVRNQTLHWRLVKYVPCYDYSLVPQVVFHKPNAGFLDLNCCLR